MADQDSRSGKTYTTQEIIDFVDHTHVPHDAALTRAFTVPDGIPSIQVGPSDGKTIHVLIKLAGTKRIVEVGTLVGYSAITMARAMPDDGHVWTIEYEPSHAEVARANIEAAGLANKITVVVGAGLDMLPTLEQHGPFDLVFIDADKANYDSYGAWAVNHLRAGGLVIGDNSYLFGRLCEETDEARAMRTFHEHVAATCDSVCIPTPDGLVVGIKR